LGRTARYCSSTAFQTQDMHKGQAIELIEKKNSTAVLNLCGKWSTGRNKEHIVNPIYSSLDTSKLGNLAKTTMIHLFSFILWNIVHQFYSMSKFQTEIN
jgi:hypothetical protein